MRRLLIPLAIIAAVAMVGGAAHLGLQSGRAENRPAEPPPPSTVPVTRGDVQQSVAAPGQLECTQQAQLSMPTTGQLARIDVRPGDSVHAGDTLAELDLAPLQKALDDARAALERAAPEHARQLAAAQLDLTVAQANLAKAQANAQAGGASDAVTIARHRLEQAKNTLWGAQVQRDSTCGRAHDAACDAAQAAVQTNGEAVRIAEVQLQQEVAKAQANQAAGEQDLAVLQAQVERAQIAVDRLKEGLDPALVHNVEAAQEALDGAALKAPFDGTVLEVMARVGETVMPSRGVALLANIQAVEVRSTVIEEDLSLVQVGQPVELYFDAQPDLVVSGRVARIVPQRAAGDRALYPIYIALDEPAPILLPGMTADASIVVAQSQGVLRLPRALVRAQQGGTAQVKVWANGQEEKRTVRVGLRGDTHVEIVAGLSEGEQVVSE